MTDNPYSKEVTEEYYDQFYPKIVKLYTPIIHNILLENCKAVAAINNERHDQVYPSFSYIYAESRRRIASTH